MTAVGFEAYWPLLFLLLLPVLGFAGARSRTNSSPRHIAVLTLLRGCALVALVLALMRPVWQAGGVDVSVVYALDVSRSVAGGFVQSALEFMRKANAQGHPAGARYVVFADRPRLVDNVDEIPAITVVSGQSASAPVSSSVVGNGAIDQGATNLERALDQALQGFKADDVKRLVLFTDGNQTDGDVWRVLPRLKAEGVRVFAFPATPRTTSDAWVESIETADIVRRDEPVSVNVRVMSQQQTRARVRLLAAGEQIGARNVSLSAGENDVALQVRLRQQGSVALTAEVRADNDEVSDNDSLTQAVWVSARPRVLYVEGQPDASKYLRDALTREGLDVTVAPGTELPVSVSGLSSFDAVILSDVPVADFGAARMQALESYVRDQAGGLIFAAGETTFGESGLAGSSLEKVLPVEFKAQEKRKDLALVICLDRSYSMKGRPMDLAKAGTRAALALLEEQHRFGVVAFDSQPHEAVPLQFVRSKRKAEDLIDRIQASGQTNIYPALATAWRMLQNVDTKRKHVILLSDGDTAPADFERLLKRMTDAQITVSTVTLGRAGDPELMGKIARWGKGKAYVAEDVAQVPEIFIQDTQDVSRTTLIEDPFKPVVKRKIEALRGLDFAQAPPLLGFASTKAKDSAEVFLATESGSPILARWQYGLGRTVMFASDVKNRWAAQWLEWPGYGRFWGQVVRETLRRDTGEDVSLRIARDGGEAQVSLSLVTSDGKWRNGVTPGLRVTRPDGSKATLQLRQTGPGQYAGKMPVATSTNAPFVFELIEGGGITRDMTRRAGERRLYYPYPDEYRSLPPNMNLLRALTEETGGKLAPEIAEIFAAQGDRGSSRKPLWPWFAGIALLLYLCDIAVRRAPWFRHWLEAG